MNQYIESFSKKLVRRGVGVLIIGVLLISLPGRHLHEKVLMAILILVVSAFWIVSGMRFLKKLKRKNEEGKDVIYKTLEISYKYEYATLILFVLLIPAVLASTHFIEYANYIAGLYIALFAWWQYKLFVRINRYLRD